MSSASRLLSLAFLAFAGLVVVASFAKPGLFEKVPRTVPDFGTLYVAASTSRQGIDPFDLEKQAPGQLAIDPKTIVQRANSGPWAIGLVSPFSLMDYTTARIAWLFLSIAIVIACGSILWKRYGGADDEAPMAWLVSLGGYASVQSLWLGQISPFILLALVGFTALYQSKPFLAGICLSLLAVKPQNQLVVLLVGTIWMIDRRQARLFFGLLFGTLLLTIMAVNGNGAIIAQYLHAMADKPPAFYRPPLPGTAIRLLIDPDRFWLTFLPLPFGLAWGIWYYVRHRADWNWLEHFPLLLFVSYLASPYGWAYDQIVFLFALFQVAVGLTAKSKTWWIALCGVPFALTGYYLIMLQRDVSEFHWIWVAPVLLIIYAIRWRVQDADGFRKTIRTADPPGSLFK